MPRVCFPQGPWTLTISSMKKTDSSVYYHEEYYAYHAHYAELAAEGGRPEDGLGACCFSASSSEAPSEDEGGTPPCPGPTLRVSASPSMADSEGMLAEEDAAVSSGFRVEDWLCCDAAEAGDAVGLRQDISAMQDPPRAEPWPESQQPRKTCLAVLLASLPYPPAQHTRKRSSGGVPCSQPACRWDLTREFLDALALRMPLLRAAAALGISAAALRAACRKVGMRTWDHRHHALAARAVATVDSRGNTRAAAYLLSVRQRLGYKPRGAGKVCLKGP
jgi:hypothetical protein